MLKWVEETGDAFITFAIVYAIMKLANVEVSWGITAGLAILGVAMSFGAFCMRERRKLPVGRDSPATPSRDVS